MADGQADRSTDRPHPCHVPCFCPRPRPCFGPRPRPLLFPAARPLLFPAAPSFWSLACPCRPILQDVQQCHRAGGCGEPSGWRLLPLQERPEARRGGRRERKRASVPHRVPGRHADLRHRAELGGRRTFPSRLCATRRASSAPKPKPVYLPSFPSFSSFPCLFPLSSDSCWRRSASS